MKSLAHIAVAMEVGATVARRLLLQIHHHHRLRPRHTRECWSGPPSPSPDRAVNRSLLSDPDAHQRGRQGGSCALHGRECPNRVALVHDPSSSSRQGEEEGDGEDEDDEHQISVVISPIGAPAICRTVCIFIGLRGGPQGPLAPRTATTPPTSTTPSLIVPRLLPTLPSSEAGPSGSRTLPDLKSPCGNQMLHRFAHLAAPFDKG
jgi:hypothetical protein